MHKSGIDKFKNNSVFFGACQSDGQFSQIANNLIGILEGAKSLILQENLLDQSSFELAINNLGQWMKLPNAALNYSIDWVEGVK